MQEAHRQVTVEGVAYRTVPELPGKACRACVASKRASYGERNLKLCSKIHVAAEAPCFTSVWIEDTPEAVAAYIALKLES
jgi:hypothetical protein